MSDSRSSRSRATGSIDRIDKPSSTAAWEELDRALDQSVVRRPRNMQHAASPRSLIIPLIFLIVVLIGILLA